MYRENVLKWIADLRSGEYRQGTGKLRLKDSYCCLGVLCESYRKDTGKGEWVPKSPRGLISGVWEFVISPDSKETDYPNIEVLQWLGIENAIDIVLQARNLEINGKIFNKTSVASVWNDAYQASFENIADMLESMLNEENGK